MDGIELCLDGVVLEKRKYTKYLGVYVDENLSWDIHCYFCGEEDFKIYSHCIQHSK